MDDSLVNKERVLLKVIGWARKQGLDVQRLREEEIAEAVQSQIRNESQ